MKSGTVNKSTPKATRAPTLAELGWAAGFLEGEGWFTWLGTSQHIGAAQVEREPLNRLRRLFGGRVQTRRKLYAPNRRRQYSWHVYGSRARGVMMTLYGLLSGFRRQQIKRIVNL